MKRSKPYPTKLIKQLRKERNAWMKLYADLIHKFYPRSAEKQLFKASLCIKKSLME